MMKRIAILCLIFGAIYALGVIILNLPGKSTSSSQNTSFNVPTPSISQKPINLKSVDEKVGTGKEAKAGDTVSVNYVGTLTNGKKFDSSYDRKEPFSFTLGQGQVIAGWDQGVIGMKVGGKRKLTIPPELGYGAAGQGTIPANSTLVFEIELLNVTSGATQPTDAQKPNLNL